MTASVAYLGATPLPAVLTVSDVAIESGVAPSAVRFYERYGVVTAVRTSSNQRRFDDSAACRIKVAKLAQRIGLTVREIAAVFADLPTDPGPADWGRIADILITEAETRTANLRAQLSSMGSGAKLCEITDQVDEQGHTPPPRPIRPTT
ncbi:MerR family transcriptional regulator [Rhodococcus sp. IEGM 1379]|uniref:MerR family transcriptional regulator n=1 Tax=Rhodococcus sp. IEGM 1379 TaxID=3047086 RepID=UPI0024B7113B|nr:MerR family transcriptional regulator [Rhodococcus sp. IEGM 1379]MDI9918883.1 MerR family DNA-binding transcriptional regulator [Rhodococcus sp. IEGM 1379]